METIFLEEKKNREGKEGKMFGEGRSYKFQVDHKSDLLFDFTQLPMCLM